MIRAIVAFFGLSAVAGVAAAAIVHQVYVPNELHDDAAMIADVVCNEARGEPITGQWAVAYVVLNRRNDPAFPNTVPAVILQPGQFASIAAAAAGECRRDREAWRRAFLATLTAMTDGEMNNSAVWFDNCDRSQAWMREHRLVERIGPHCFWAR